MEAPSGLLRDDSFDTVDDDFRPRGRAAKATVGGGGENAAALGRQPSSGSDNFSVGGEDGGGGEGYWGRQGDPESGLAYYLNEKVGVCAYFKRRLIFDATFLTIVGTAAFPQRLFPFHGAWKIHIVKNKS